MPQRRLIFNADDFGYSKGVNEGIIESHVKGIVTSTSVMVLRKFAYEASSLKKFPKLSIGLHLDMTEPGFQMWKDLSYIFLMKNSDIESAFLLQLEKFEELVGKMPDHIDGHNHVHKHPKVWPIVKKYAIEKNIPIRDASVAKFRIDFFGKSAFGYDKTEKVSSEALIKLIKKLPRGTYEIVCHPAKDPMNDLSLRSTNTGYLHQRALELKTLTDPSVIEFIENEGSISLINWKDVPAAIV